MFSIAGTGCTLLDYIYSPVDFSSEAVKRYRSLSPGDGGLEPGKLVFTEDFERFAGRDCLGALGEITGGRPPQAANVGGPGVVPMINAAQLLDPARFSVKFYLVAMLFILFDIEVVFMYPWAVVYRDMLADHATRNLIFASMLSFLGILFVGYLYAVKKKAFDWRS